MGSILAGGRAFGKDLELAETEIGVGVGFGGRAGKLEAEAELRLYCQYWAQVECFRHWHCSESLAAQNSDSSTNSSM